jgi:hypothetical protein
LSAGLLLPNYIYLWNSGEFLSLEKIAKIQASTLDDQLTIYGSAVHDDSFFYKEKLLAAKKPEIAIIGSSRVMQFRGFFFSKNFLNLGGSMSSFNEGWSIIKDIKTVSPEIKTLIIGVDFWWFHEKSGNTFRHEQPPRITIKKIIAPFSWLAEKKITIGEYFSTIFHGRKSQCLIGVMASTRYSGYGQDGSYYYADKELGSKAVMKQIALTRKYADLGYVRFRHADKYDRNRFEKFMQILDFLQQNQIRPVVILTPVAPSVASEMKNLQNKYAFVSEFRSELQKRGVQFFDFIDPILLDVTDYEFYDGIHSSESTCAKMLKYIAESEKVSKFGEFLNFSKIEEFATHPEMLNSLPYKRPDIFP